MAYNQQCESLAWLRSHSPRILIACSPAFSRPRYKQRSRGPALLPYRRQLRADTILPRHFRWTTTAVPAAGVLLGTAGRRGQGSADVSERRSRNATGLLPAATAGPVSRSISRAAGARLYRKFQERRAKELTILSASSAVTAAAFLARTCASIASPISPACVGNCATWHVNLTPSRKRGEQPMYYGQQPMNQPNVVVQQPRDSGPGCCAVCCGCLAALLWCVQDPFSCVWRLSKTMKIRKS